MTQETTTRLFNNGVANTRYLTVPAQVVTDSQFPFEEDDDVVIRLEDRRLVVKPTDATDDAETDLNKTEADPEKTDFGSDETEPDHP